MKVSFTIDGVNATGDVPDHLKTEDEIREYLRLRKPAIRQKMGLDPEERTFFQEEVSDSVMRGIARLAPGFNHLQTALGLQTPEEGARDIADAQARLNLYPQDPDDEAARQKWEEDLGGLEAALHLITNPSFAADMALESVGTLSPQLGLGALALAAAPFTGGSSLAAGAFALSQGLGGAGTEFLVSFADKAEELAAEKGLDLTKPEDYAAFTQSKEFDEARNYGLTRGGVIGAAEALTGKLGYAAASSVVKGGLLSKAGKKIAAGTAVEMPGAAAGEAAAQVASGEELVPKEIVAELMLEGVFGPLYAGTRSYTSTGGQREEDAELRGALQEALGQPPSESPAESEAAPEDAELEAIADENAITEEELEALAKAEEADPEIVPEGEAAPTAVAEPEAVEEPTGDVPEAAEDVDEPATVEVEGFQLDEDGTYRATAQGSEIEIIPSKVNDTATVKIDGEEVSDFDSVEEAAEWVGLEAASMAKTPEEAPTAPSEADVEADKAAADRKEAAEKVVQDRLSKIRERGEQGARVAAGVETLLSSGKATPEQAYAAFEAANVLSTLLPEGARHDVQFLDKVVTTAEAAAASGAEADTVEAAGTRRAATDTLDGLIRISLGERFDPATTAAHEAFHVLQDHYKQSDKKASAVLDRAFPTEKEISFDEIDPSVVKLLQSVNLPNSRLTAFDAVREIVGDRTLTGSELQAYAYQYYDDAVRRGDKVNALPPIRRLFKFISDFRDRFGNALRGNGFNNAEDIFQFTQEGGGQRLNTGDRVSPEVQKLADEGLPLIGARVPQASMGAKFRKGIDMSEPARKARAQKLGYDTALTLYHGTTRLVAAFLKDKMSPYSFYGKGVYTTTSAEDAVKNYAPGLDQTGPDLEAKIEVRTDSLRWIFDDDMDYILELADELGIEGLPVNDPYEGAKVIAEAEINGKAHNVMPLFGRSVKPLIMDGPRKTRFDLTDEVDRQGIIDAIYEVDAEHTDPEAVVHDVVYENAYVGDYDAKTLFRDLQDAWYLEEGFDESIQKEVMVGREMARQVFEELGYDSILMDATATFPFMRLPPNTWHQIFFQPSQLRSKYAAFNEKYAESPELQASTASEIKGHPDGEKEDAAWRKIQPKRDSNGKILGAPSWVNEEPRGLQKLRTLLRKLVDEGTIGRYWYEESAREALKIAGGDLSKADKFVGLLAIYSPQARVDTNTGFAIKAYTQWANGEPVKVKTSDQDGKAQRWLDSGEDWGDSERKGRKVHSFYLNIMHELVTEASEADLRQAGIPTDVLENMKRATVDVWVLRAMGYDVERASELDKGAGKYSFSEDEIRKLTGHLNARVPTGKQRWLPHQVQAALWTAVKARYEIKSVKEKTDEESLKAGFATPDPETGKAKAPKGSGPKRVGHMKIWRKNALAAKPADVARQVESAKGSFADMIGRIAQNVTLEAIPAPELGHPLLRADDATQREFTGRAFSLLLDEYGNDQLAQDLGVALDYATPSVGGFEDTVSPNVIKTLIPIKPRGRFDNTSALAYARAVQYIFMQKAVPIFRADPTYSFEGDFRVVGPKGKTQKRFNTQEAAEKFAAEKEGRAVVGGNLARGVAITFGGELTPEAEKAFYTAVQEQLGSDPGFTKVDPSTVAVVNYRGDNNIPFVRDDLFVEALAELESEYGESLNIQESVWFGSEGEYGPEHDWSKDRRGAARLAEASAGRSSDFQSWLVDRHKAFRRLLQEYEPKKRQDQEGVEREVDGTGSNPEQASAARLNAEALALEDSISRSGDPETRRVLARTLDAVNRERNNRTDIDEAIPEVAAQVEDVVPSEQASFAIAHRMVRMGLKPPTDWATFVNNPSTGTPEWGRMAFKNEARPVRVRKGIHFHDPVEKRDRGYGLRHFKKHLDDIFKNTVYDSVDGTLIAELNTNAQKWVSKSNGHLNAVYKHPKSKRAVHAVFARIDDSAGKFWDLVTVFDVDPDFKINRDGSYRNGTAAQASVSPGSIEGIQRRVHQNETDRLLGRNVNKITGHRWYKLLRRKLQDKMLPLRDFLDDLVANGGVVAESMNTYIQEELMSGVVGTKIKRATKDVYTPLIEAIRNSPVSMEELGEYLHARHARERNAYIKRIAPDEADLDSGMSDAEADAVLARIAAEGKLADYERLAALVDAIIAETNRVRKEGGLVGKNLEGPFKHYVPLRGFAGADEINEEINNRKARTGAGAAGISGREDPKISGRSESEVPHEDIIANVIHQNMEAITRAEKNLVGQSFLRLVRANKDNMVLASTGEPAARIVRGIPKIATVINGKRRLVADPSYRQKPSQYLVVKVNGREVVVEMQDTLLANALNGNNGLGEANKIVATLGSFNRLLANLNTAWNPEFLFSNFPRDLQTALVAVQGEIDGKEANKGLAGRILKDVRAAMSAIGRAEFGQEGANSPKVSEYMAAWDEMQKSGGTVEFLGIRDLNSIRDDVNRQLKMADPSKLDTVRRAAAAALKGIDSVNRAVENASRLALYKNLRDLGYSPQKAASAAKNLTVNFNRKGELGTLMNSLYLFYNASLQGTMVLANTLRSKRGRRAVAGLVVAGIMMDQLNALMSPEDDDGEKAYDKILEHAKEHNLILMNPFGEGTLFQFPLPYGFNVFYGLGLYLSSVARGATSPFVAAGRIMAMGVDAFNPVGGTHSFLSFAAPTILDPIADLGKNENFFGGRIYPEQNPFTPYKPASQQHWSNTSAGWKLIAQSLNTLTGGNEYQSGYIDHSPEVYEYWFDFATGSAGKFVSRVTSGAGMLLTGDIVDIEANDIPLVRKLYGEVGKRADVERYYNNKEEVLAVRQAVKDAVKNGDRERAKEIRQDEKARLSIAGAFASIDRAISNLRAQRKRLLANENISDDKRDKMVERVEGLIERQITRANRLYNERVKGK